MKKDQEELFDTIENVLSTLSSEYIVDMFIVDYHKPIWYKNRGQVIMITYFLLLLITPNTAGCEIPITLAIIC